MTTRMGKAALAAGAAALLIGAAGWQGRASAARGGWVAFAMEWLDRPLVG